MLRRSISAGLALMAVSCSRPETPEYFTKVTGLPLCQAASIKNVNANDPARSPGFDSIYVVDVLGTDGCKAELIRAVEKRIGQQCIDGSCSGLDSSRQFIGVIKVNNGLRVTYST